MHNAKHPLGAPSSPPAVRLRRPGWRDPRLLLGLVLVASSVALGSWLVASAGRTVPVYVAGETLVPGQALGAGDVSVRQVRLEGGTAAYLSAEDPVPEGLVLTRTVDEGELVARSAVSAEVDLGLRPVAVEPAGPLPRGVVTGSTVDLWFVPQPAGGAGGAGVGAAEAAPRELATGLTVAEVAEPDGTFAVGTEPTVHVLVPVADLPDVLAALAAEGSVEIVHVPGSASR
ncbi:hypothetical protein [Actinotalea subterranea]|uniref:hypothetical protein n=1 Tax=Actinotalea subterranea TaxID=2607497 RepID=UPI0011EF971E|nr:hypothetical protein [Actinotalea subterranea]